MQARSLTQSEMRNISEEKKELLENLTAVYAQGGKADGQPPYHRRR